MAKRPSRGFQKALAETKARIDAVIARGTTPPDPAAPTPPTPPDAAPDVELVAEHDEEGNPRHVVAEGARRGLRKPGGR